MRLDDDLIPPLYHGPAVLGAQLFAAGAQVYSARAAARLQKRAARHNANVAQQQADDARRRGESRVNRYRQRLRALLGRQRAVMSSSGADLGSGSPQQIQLGQELLGALDVKMIQANAEREAWGHEAMIPQFAFQEEAARIEAFGGTIGGIAQGVGAVAATR